MDQNVRVVTRGSNSGLVFDKCCCCIPLRTGCLILGYLQLVAYIIGGIFALMSITTGVALLNSEVEEGHKYIAKILIIFGAVVMVMMLIALPFTILLLVGLHKEKRNYIKYYLIFAVVCFLLNIVVQIAKYAGGYAAAKEIPSVIVNIALTIYFLLVLRSQYIKLGQTSNPGAQHYRADGHLMNVQKV